MIYMDNNATTLIDPRVQQVMRMAETGSFANPSSPHPAGARAAKHLEMSRQMIAQLINADPSEIIFTSGATESNNLAIRGFFHPELARSPYGIAISDSEHKSVLRACLAVENEGVPAVYLETNILGDVRYEQVDKLHKTGLLSVMMANNETGHVNEIKEMSEIAKKKGITFHTDAVQAFGKIPVDVKDLGVDMMTICAHKLHGPRGIGALYVRKGTEVKPFMVGGPQERHLRPGTENVAGAVGFARAAEIACSDLQRNAHRMYGMIRTLEDMLFEGLHGYCCLNTFDHRLPNTLNMSFFHLDSKAIILLLAEKGICVSDGSACQSGIEEPSHVLKAMRVSEEEMSGAIRFSISRFTEPEEIEIVGKATVEVVKELRTMLDPGKREEKFGERSKSYPG